MGGPRRDVLERIAAAFNARDAEAFAALCDPAVQIDSRISRAGGRPFRGHEGIRAWLREVDETFDFMVTQIDQVLETDERLPATGDFALAVGSARWRGRGSGVETREPLAWAAEFKGGLLYRVAIYESPEQALGVLTSRQGG